MLDKNDVTLLKGMFGELLRDNNEILRDEMRAIEKRLIRRMDHLHEEIVTDIGSLLDDNVLPQIADLQLKLA